MAREYARLMVKIWDDPDWLNLTGDEQTSYAALISSQDLDYAGILPYLPSRYAHICRKMTERKFIAALGALEAITPPFVVIDRETAEILVRTYIRHDEVLRIPNVAKAMAKAVGKIRSPRLRAVVIDELVGLTIEAPDAKGWRGIEDGYPDLYAEVAARASLGVRGTLTGTLPRTDALLPSTFNIRPSSSDSEAPSPRAYRRAS